MQVIPGGNGLTLLKFNGFQTLLTAAEAYFHLGYAVIPLLGDFDPNRPKVATRSWSAYQQRLATLDEISQWFSEEGDAGALGIVTGRVSHLAVLDFDSADLFTDFRRRFPNLLDTRTIQSAGRGLPHLYFHVPSHLPLASQKSQGVDLLSDGRYVVAPPTIINAQAYKITRAGMPRSLTEHDIQRLQSFMAEQKSTSSVSIPINPRPSLPVYMGEGAKEGLRPSTTLIPLGHMPLPLNLVLQEKREELISPLPEMYPADVSACIEGRVQGTRASLHGLYHYWRSKTARNEALFRTAIYARDHGWDQSQTRSALVALHVSQAGMNTTHETQAIRQREAYATIRSAFSRPARFHNEREGHRASPTEHKGNSLPNSVREALMQRKLTYVVRTLEGLLQAGFRAGKGFSTDQAIETLKGIVGRDSVYNALNALAANGQPFFPQHIPSALPKASNEAANQKQPLKTKKCFFVTEKKSGIKKRGIQPRRFKIPTTKDLCRLLGVKTSGSDPLTRDDLKSAHQTRMALHRELIKRRPAEYSRRWLANRLGVSRRTINTYNRLIPIHTRPTYQESGLSWASIDSLLSDEALAGAFIETLTGKKYPALHAIAANLLAKGTYIRLKQRTSNLYWYGSDDPPPNILFKDKSVAIESPSRQIRQERDYESQPYPGGKEEIEPQRRKEGGDQKEQLNHRVTGRLRTATESAEIKAERLSNIVGVRRASSAQIPSPTAIVVSKVEQEALAQTIYTRIDGLSLKNARKLAKTYTEKNIHLALQRLQQRTNLDNPSGFFVSILRSTARMEERI